MGKFGKRNDVSLNPLDYNITILGESGIGKTTLAKETCEYLGVDYIHFDIGNEFGAAAIQGIISEHIENWAKLTEVIDDIVENKQSDYPDLKVIVWDTLDELVPIAEDEVIRLHNKKNPDNKVDSINAAFGGFGRGQEKAIEIIIDKFSELRNVGVSSILIGHLKKVDVLDPITNETFSKLTADTTQKYFNAIKNKQHFVAVCYIDREIVKEKTGRKNVATKQDITINKVVKESRVISFRDDTYSVDSKSRFAEIVDKVPFETEAFVGAMKDAILAEQSKSGVSLKDAEKKQKEREAKAAEAAVKYSETVKAANSSPSLEDLVAEVTKLYKDPETSADNKAEMKAALKELGYRKISDIESVDDIQSLLDIIKK